MRKDEKLKIGIIGCGAIGSRVAKAVNSEFKNLCLLSGLYDINLEKTRDLARDLSRPGLFKSSYESLLLSSDFIVEAVNATNTRSIIRQALQLKKGILVMSVGKLLMAKSLFQLAKRNNCPLLIPSGAIAGLDTIKAATQGKVSRITLTTKKPPLSFKNNSYLTKKGINLKKIKAERVLFEGNVNKAVKFFPQNINVAATIALACKDTKKLGIRIITSPKFRTNSHEIEIIGNFGQVNTRVQNLMCPDNPKTSYLAILSAIQTLKEFFNTIKIGT